LGEAQIATIKWELPRVILESEYLDKFSGEVQESRCRAWYTKEKIDLLPLLAERPHRTKVTA
jgi:hypothetical protein